MNAKKRAYIGKLKPEDVKDLRRFEILERKMDTVADTVYRTALRHKDNSLGLYGTIFYAAMLVMVKTEQLAKPKTEKEKKDWPQQIAFIKDMIEGEAKKRGVI